MDDGASEAAVVYDHFFTHWHVGDLASIVGVLLAIAGFWVTIYQIREAKRQASLARSAAEQAKSAADSALNHRRLLDSNAALSESSVRLGEIKSMILADQMDDIIPRYDTLCTQIVVIKEEMLAAGHKNHGAKLGSILQILRDTQRSTIRLSKTPDKLKHDKLHDALSHIQDDLVAMSGQIRNAGSQVNGTR
jgi:hypothetical protein